MVIFGSIKIKNFCNTTMTLYHYTSIESFRKIWESKSLLFSLSENTNDFFERFKTFVLTQETFKCDGKQLDRNRFDNFDVKIREELSKYRQVSFSYDYDDGLKGYASPMMWGQYAWHKMGEEWQNGVCIAIDSDKIKRPLLAHPDKVRYSFTLEPPIVENIDYTKEDAAALFVERNMKTYFFTKHQHWGHENEYRFICKQDGVLDISEAIMGVYTLFDNNTPLGDIEDIVKDCSLIRLVTLDDIEKHKEPCSLKDIYDAQELMNNFNKRNVSEGKKQHC